jgi:hypothetical protein
MLREAGTKGERLYLVEYDLPPKDRESLHKFYKRIQEPEYLGERVSKRTSTTSVVPLESLELALKIKALAVECNGKAKVWKAELIE